MNKNYKFPINLFIIIEHAAPVVYTSSVLPCNHFVIFLKKKYNRSVTAIIKNEVHFWKSSLIEQSAIDTLSYDNFAAEVDVFFKHARVLVYYIFYLYKLKCRLTMAYYGEQFFESVDLIYRNSNWLERETSEMYNIYFKKKLDSRKLLLDYTIDINPMLKDYPSEGEYDCYFSNIENQVVLEKNQTVEL